MSSRLWLNILPWPRIHHSSQYLKPQFRLLELISHYHLFIGIFNPQIFLSLPKPLLLVKKIKSILGAMESEFSRSNLTGIFKWQRSQKSRPESLRKKLSEPGDPSWTCNLDGMLISHGLSGPSQACQKMKLFI